MAAGGEAGGEEGSKAVVLAEQLAAILSKKLAAELAAADKVASTGGEAGGETGGEGAGSLVAIIARPVRERLAPRRRKRVLMRSTLEAPWVLALLRTLALPRLLMTPGCSTNILRGSWEGVAGEESALRASQPEDIEVLSRQGARVGHPQLG